MIAMARLVLFASSIFSSAFLLFQVQPLISKAILPWFGGSSAVWTTAMLFFQSVLCAGYTYSHFLTRYLNRKWQVVVHLVVLLAASLLASGILPDIRLQPIGSEDPAIHIMRILIVSVGLPYFALATTGPLLQHWISITGHTGSVYRLYALSNVGSLIALLSYPYYFERTYQLSTLGTMWSVSFLIFAILCAASATLVAFHNTSTSSAISPAASNTHQDNGGESDLQGWIDRSAWILLPALGSLAMVATTEHISHHIAPEPQLWITTLSLYLLSFIISFDHPRWYKQRWVAGLCIAGITLLCGQDEIAGLLGIKLELSMTTERWEHFVVMFLICLLCHGELFRRRPTSNTSLTAFYLSISVGGALGGLFVALIATKFFSDYHEWTVLLVLTLWLSFHVLSDKSKKNLTALNNSFFSLRNLSIYATTFVLLSGLVVYWNDPFAMRDRENESYRFVTRYQARNFFGVVSVEEDQYFTTPEKNIRLFRSGHILHGHQYLSPDLQRLRNSYYTENSGVGEALLHLQKNLPSMKVAIVGLGTGTLMNYARPTDQYDLFEINPEVIEIAKKWFTNIKNSNAGSIQYYLGDARVQLAGMKELKKYDLIVLDAFTGDSVPVHLLSREAFELYARHLAPGGMIAVHITNRYLNLYAVVKRQAQELGMGYRSRYQAKDSEGIGRRSHYIILSSDNSYLMHFPSTYRAIKLPDGSMQAVEPEIADLPLWTDSFSSIGAIEIKD